MPAMMISCGPFGYFFNIDRDPSVASLQIAVQVQGIQNTGNGWIPITYGSTYADLISQIKAAAVQKASDQLGVTIGPDDPIQIFGGPQPTLADLGG